MKKIIMPCIAMFLLSFWVQPAFANKENHAEHIQVMRQASAELQASNPDLAKKLSDFADKKEKHSGEKEKDWAEHLQQKRQDLAKIKQVSDALKGNNDGLSKDLNDISDRWEKHLKEKEKWMDKKHKDN